MQPKKNFELPVREKIISDRGSVHVRFYSLSFKNKGEGWGRGGGAGGCLNSFLPLKKKGLNSGFTVSYLPPTDIRASINLFGLIFQLLQASIRHKESGGLK